MCIWYVYSFHLQKARSDGFFFFCWDWGSCNQLLAYNLLYRWSCSWFSCISFPASVTSNMCHNLQHLKAETCDFLPFLSVENGSLVGEFLKQYCQSVEGQTWRKAWSPPSKPLLHRRWLIPLGKRENTKVSLRGICVTPSQRYKLINSLRKGLVWFHNSPHSLWIFFWLFYGVEHDSKPKTNEDFLPPYLK